ncbi:MAG: rhomboid family intramembrane serine protease [Candidatus Aenigmarchaeota archaeon]|nr:rhomboid family intramembrane serine protease [Candidatus Aenigmarchaeota archaeon]
MEKRKPNLTYSLIIIFATIFLFQIYSSIAYGEQSINWLFNRYGFSLNNILEGNLEVFLTSVFLHGDLSHLLMNMIALFFFGRVIEKELGRKKFLLIFFVSAIVGNFAVLTMTLLGYGSAIIPTIGASAAIFGLVGTSMLVKPFEFIFYPYLVPVPLILVALLYALYNIAEFFVSITVGVTTNVSYISHIGGLLTGMVFGSRHKNSKRGLIVLLIIILLMVLTPFAMIFFNYLEFFNYIDFISWALG